MASNSKRSRDDKTKFTEAEKNWNLEKLYEDLRGKKQKVLTDTEKCHLRGLLCGYSPQEIAEERVIEVGTINDALSKTLYRYIEDLLNSEKKIRHWSHVTDFLEKAGYKIQLCEQSQFNHPLPDEKENILEPSHKIGAISFLEYFSKSIDQLKSKDLDVRIGAISTLGTLAKYSQPAEHWTIMEYLAVFIRTNAPRKEEEEREERAPKLSGDIQAALTVIGQRDLNNDKGSLDLTNTDITRADLWGARLQRVNLRKAYLKQANLREAHLEGATLDEAHLEQADLMGAYLQGASLEAAHLQQANFNGAHLNGAKLRGSHLKEVHFAYADLERVDLVAACLKYANLIETNLEEADLRGAKLGWAILQGACLRGANFGGANLHEAHLEGTDITVARNLEPWQIDSAYGDSPNSLPQIVRSSEDWNLGK